MASQIPQCLLRRGVAPLERNLAPRSHIQRQCRNSGASSRRNLWIASQTPKNEIRSRPAQQTRNTLAENSSARSFISNNARSLRPFSSTPRQSYKTVEEAKSKYRLGVCITLSYLYSLYTTAIKSSPNPKIPKRTNKFTNQLLPTSPSHGKQASSSSSQAPA